MKASLVLFTFLIFAILTQKTECFTAGIGNVGVKGKREFQVYLFICFLLTDKNATKESPWRRVSLISVWLGNLWNESRNNREWLLDIKLRKRANEWWAICGIQFNDRNHMVLNSKQHHSRVLLSSFHLNGHTLGFHPQIQKTEPPCTA